MDTQALIDASRTGDLSPIRTIVDCKNQKLYFQSNAHIAATDLQQHALAMLLVALEHNSDVVFGALRHLNVMHKLRPTVRFEYSASVIECLDFGCTSIAATLMDDFFLTIGACVDSPFNGARPEALVFFEYWIRDACVADTVLARLLTAWPWTNRNKYYFLSILFDRHGFEALLARNSHLAIDVDELMAGVTLSLQYRNLISPGQTLAITLARQLVPQIFTAIAAIVREDSFRATNCLNHWMRCIANGHLVFAALELDSEEILSGGDAKFGYLLDNSLQRLIQFRCCFKASFEKAANCQEVDAFVVRNEEAWDVAANKVALLDFIISKTMSQPAELAANLPVLERALKSNMPNQMPSLRNDVLKMLPNLMYLMAPILKADTNTPRICEFFGFLRTAIFARGIAQPHDYPPLIYALRVYEIVVKTIYGARSDRLIKRFNADVNDRLRCVIDDDAVWPLFTDDNYQTLCQLLQSEFNDVRDIACELLIRFFPPRDMLHECRAAIEHVDDMQCGYAHYMARVAIQLDAQQAGAVDGLYEWLHTFLHANLADYTDPLRRIRSGGGHLFGALNCVNEFYTEEARQGRAELSAEQIGGDLRLATDVVGLVLGFFRYGNECGDSAANGSPSFERMDESLTQLVALSRWQEDERLSDAEQLRLREQSKKWLLMSLWTSMKAACDLATSIGIYLLHQDHLLSTADERSIELCYQLSVRVLLQCRHKGAIEAAGLSLGRLVAAITKRVPVASPLFAHLLDSVATMFGIVGQTDTTRRGAGFSIMVLHLVKSDRNKEQPLLHHVMRKLLAQGTEMQTSASTNLHRDNMLASVLHFMCVLVKDGDLRLPLTEYMSAIFAITVATIDSREWVVRNASLQLFGALVPKLVGQSQFFINDLAWQPVHLLYADIRLKMHSLHTKILHLLQTPAPPTILLVTALQLLARTETVDIQAPAESQLRCHFFRFLAHTNMKVRELAAMCSARFHQFYEIPDLLARIVPLLAGAEVNLRHGLLCTMELLLRKYESDSRCMPHAIRWVSVESRVRADLAKHWGDGWPRHEAGRYYLLGQVHRVLRAIGCDDADALMRTCVFGGPSTEVSLSDSQHYGFSAWLDLKGQQIPKERSSSTENNCPVMELRRRSDDEAWS